MVRLPSYGCDAYLVGFGADSACGPVLHTGLICNGRRGLSLTQSPTICAITLALARQDTFIAPHHCYDLHAKYAGDKQCITFKGDHHTQRTKEFFESAAQFLHQRLTEVAAPCREHCARARPVPCCPPRHPHLCPRSAQAAETLRHAKSRAAFVQPAVLALGSEMPSSLEPPRSPGIPPPLDPPPTCPHCGLRYAGDTPVSEVTTHFVECPRCRGPLGEGGELGGARPPGACRCAMM